MWALLYSAHAYSDVNHFQIRTKMVLEAELKKHVMNLETWVDQKNKDGFDLLCFGESHNFEFRQFYANKILRSLKIDHLALEGRQDVANRAVANFVEQRDEELLVTGVDIRSVLNSVFAKNGLIGLSGVENSVEEKKILQQLRLDYIIGPKFKNTLGRDSFIANRVSKLIDSGEKNIAALYGSSHCSNLSDGLGVFSVPFSRLLKDHYGNSKNIESVKAVTKEDFKTEKWRKLKAYLDEFGLIDQDAEAIVISGASQISPQNYNYSQNLYTLFQKYDVIIIEI
jgi:hypothetical protein